MDTILNYINGVFKSYNGKLHVSFEIGSVKIKNIEDLNVNVFHPTGVFHSGPKIFVFNQKSPYSYIWIDSKNKIAIGNLKSQANVERNMSSEIPLERIRGLE
jgi:hypothetical protein